MVDERVQNGEVRYRCPVCGLEYREREWAEKCEAWCREHPSCNVEVIQHAIKGVA
ncbi:hypothetical protein HYZ80_03870 [Candidatus Parcubacteria bacterium]|nr:hypothetical protein [Candidatus Parcubacteria bacterium]